MNRSFLILTVCALTVLAGCAPAAVTRPDALQNVPMSPSEVIGTDVFASLTPGDTVTVAGVRLGMTQAQVLALLGPADKAEEYDFGAVTNWEYGAGIGLSDTGIIVHFENGFVTRITMLEPLNKYLIGSTQIGTSKETIYNTLGLPDRQYDIKSGRFFVYNTRGIEVYLRGDTAIAYGIVLSNRKLPSTATVPGLVNDPLVPKTPRLIIDTTTLCDQGPTQAFNPGSGECTAYTSHCLVPDSWIEVKSCEPTDVTNEALVAALRSQQ